MGIVHAAFLHRETWLVVCETEAYFHEVRRVGSSKLRISLDQVTCLWCAIGKSQ